MPSPSSAAPGSEAVASTTAPCPPLPADLEYYALGLLPTDSKMSEILLATDRYQQRVVLKIACVQQRVRAETNRRAIHNSVAWLQKLQDHAGVAQMRPLQRKSERRPGAWFTPPTFVGTLPDWPGAPDFLVTEYLPGGTLSSFVGKHPLPLELALGLTYDLACTLAYLHAHGCVHRDLKPENILFRTVPSRTAQVGELQPALIDFGIAAQAGEPKLISGSRLWMAPEVQVAYEKSLLPVEPNWDVYALGLICCYMLSGLRPQRQQHTHQDYVHYRELVFTRLQQTVANADQAQAEVVAGLEQILTRALDYNPQQRPSAAEFAAVLATLLAQLGVNPPTERAVRKRGFEVIATRLQQLPQPKHLVGLTGLAVLLLFVFSRFWGSDPEVRAGISPAGEPAVALISSVQVADPSIQVSQEPVQTGQPVTAPASPPTLAQPTLPPPTLAALPTQRQLAIPTLAVVTFTPQVTPPTLAALIPTLVATRTPPTPTATDLPPAPTPSATTPVTPRQSTRAAGGVIRLRSPATDAVSAQGRVEFIWESSGPLAAEHCYELVFWDRTQSQDKRSPIGAGRATRGTVNFGKLRDSPDPLLQTLARSPQGFDWGVRLVNCASPKTVVQDVGEVRHFTYQP